MLNEPRLAVDESYLYHNLVLRVTLESGEFESGDEYGFGCARDDNDGGGHLVPTLGSRVLIERTETYRFPFRV